jgi:hypothetical protein
MTLRPALIFHLLCLAVLRFASLMVPRAQRSEWWREWSSELWHVRQTCTPSRGISLPAEREVAAFCFGAFEDARCLREQSREPRLPRAPIMGSATQSIVVLAGLVTASLALAVVLPGVREQFYQYRYRIAPNIVLLQNAFATADDKPTISIEQFRVWKDRRQQLFDNFAYYRIARESVPNASAPHVKWNIAHATTNLPQLLGLPIQFASEHNIPSGQARLILSDTLWRREFAGDPQIVGQTLHFGQQIAVIIGIAPAGSWRLPGKVDAWLLEPDTAIAPGRSGFVLAQLLPSAERELLGAHWHLSAPTPDGTRDDFVCSSLARRTHSSLGVFLFAIILACLALPATTPLPLGEYRTGSRKLSWSTRLRRWSFLATKIALLLPLVLFVSVDLAHLRPAVDQNTSDYIQLISAFSICLFGLRWALRDQRQRCPVCLGKLTHPARVGQPSRNFLAWNGTELICTGGHGLLHVPEIPTSWFSTQRWLYLDPSWEVLFAETSLAPLYF